MSQIPDRIGFSTGSSWLSCVIRWFTDSAASHAWILYWDSEFEADCVLEFTRGGCRITTLTSFEKHNRVVKKALPRHPISLGMKKVAEWLDKPYDYKGLFGMVWVMVGRWLHRKWKNPWGSAQAMFCSEAVARVLRAADYPGTEYWDPETISPQDLFEFFLRESSKPPLGPAPTGEVHDGRRT